MQWSSGHWYPVLSSRELGKRPLARRRFGERLVFWRSNAGQAVCLEDRCAHRGAALSLGKVCDGDIECPFHGFRFAADGVCTRVPAEGNWPIPAQLRVRACTLREAEGYLWLWRGPAASTEALPALPRQPSLDGLCWGETRSTWPAHYTRCIENVIDYSHLPFVHRRNLGLFNRDPVTRVRVDARPGGFLFFRLDDKPGRQFVDFTYPTLWLNTLGDRFHLAATFVPIDDDHTEVYVRWYHPWDWPGIRALVDVYGRWSQKIVFRDDLPIVASQQPRNVDDADSDHLVPSDAALLAFRRLRRQHQQETRQAQGIDLP